MSSLQVRITVFAAASLFIAALYMIISRVEYQETYQHLNRNLNVAGVQLHMAEDDVIALLGEGEYVDGFGGHARDYKDRGIRIGFSNDQDNDMYERVSDVECNAIECTVYGIRQGDAISDAEAVLLEQGYEKAAGEQHFQNGEYVIMLQGEQKVEMFSVYFRDKDLLDRIY